MLILPSPGTLPVIESAGHSGDVGIKPAPAAAITSDSDESSITKCGWSIKVIFDEIAEAEASKIAMHPRAHRQIPPRSSSSSVWPDDYFRLLGKRTA